ncbi:hypothetical protein [Streptomyces sp. URMC 129]|uniref:hypothetical protein n=1 Tax=Streptomyces sp. URMC 129 TaxID=3423407 RepID=UPI003F1A2673
MNSGDFSTEDGMQETVSSLVITVVAGLGSLATAMLAQRQTSRCAALELDRLAQHHAIEREGQMRRDDIQSHRISYTALNTAARRYLAALTDQMHALRTQANLATVTAELQRARTAHADCYAEVQLLASDSVLAAARSVNRTLNTTYGMLMRLSQGARATEESLNTAQAQITDLWDYGLATLRERMRMDLGIDETRAPAPLTHHDSSA